MPIRVARLSEKTQTIAFDIQRMHRPWNYNQTEWPDLGSLEKVYCRSQMLERPSIGKNWNISGVPVLLENVIFTFSKTCQYYKEAHNTATQKRSSIAQYSCTSSYQYLGLEVHSLRSLEQHCMFLLKKTLSKVQVLR